MCEAHLCMRKRDRMKYPDRLECEKTIIMVQKAEEETHAYTQIESASGANNDK